MYVAVLMTYKRFRSDGSAVTLPKYQPRPQRRFSLFTSFQVAPASSDKYRPPLPPGASAAGRGGVRPCPGAGFGRAAAPPMGFAMAVPISSTTAQTRRELAGDTETPMRPTTSSSGNPPPSFFHVSPPSVDLYKPPPGRLVGAYTDHGGRRVDHSDAYTRRGFFGSIVMSAAPTSFGLSALNRTFFQVAPPSVER